MPAIAHTSLLQDCTRQVVVVDSLEAVLLAKFSKPSQTLWGLSLVISTHACAHAHTHTHAHTMR